MSVFPFWGWSAHITTQDYDDTPDAGTMERAARADHRHGMPAAGGGGGGGEAFPVGSVFVAVVATDPATLLGYGTWAAFAAGRVLIGRDPGDTDFDTALETGGAKSRAISAHSGATVGDHAAQSHSAHSGATVGDHAAQSHSAHSGTAVGTSGAGSSHTHTGPSHQHTYTDVVNHVHVQNVNTASTGGLSGYTADTSTNTPAASGYSTANPTGGVATGTTAAGGTGATGAESAHTHAAGTVTQPSAHSDHAALSHTVGQPAAHSDHAALSHTVGQPAAHSDVNVVQPYIVVYMWERTA